MLYGQNVMMHLRPLKNMQPFTNGRAARILSERIIRVKQLCEAP